MYIVCLFVPNAYGPVTLFGRHETPDVTWLPGVFGFPGIGITRLISGLSLNPDQPVFYYGLYTKPGRSHF